MNSELIKKLSEKAKGNKYIIIAVIFGIILMLLPFGSGGEERTEYEAPEFSLEEQEKKLENMLENIQGAGKVKVMLTLKTSTEQVLATDEDLGTDGDSKRDTVVVSKGSGEQGAVTVKYIYPEYLGAAVVAEGADSASVKLAIAEMVSAVTGLEVGQISVMKMNNH